jgi:hypothetical protein
MRHPGVSFKTPGGGPPEVRAYNILIHDVVAEVRTQVVSEARMYLWVAFRAVKIR